MDKLEDNYWKKPTETYRFHHLWILGYVNVTFIAIESILNICMVLVLTRKNMRTPINTIFTHYTAILTIGGFIYLLRSYHEFFRVEFCSIPKHKTCTWEKISYYSYALMGVCHHIAVWMAMMLGVWRYIAVKYPLKERRYCNMEITKKFILAGYFSILLIMLPLVLSGSVAETIKYFDRNGCSAKNTSNRENVTICEFQVPLEDNPFLYKLTTAIYGVIVKILPSVVLIVISLELIKTILEARKRRIEMVVSSRHENRYNTRMKQQIKQRTDRTTTILLVILALFVLGEVPHGICLLLTAYFGPKFFWKYYYYNAMEIINTSTLITETIHFFLYYSMNPEFRNTFKSLLSRSSNSRMMNSQKSSSSLYVINRIQNDSTSPPTISSN